MARMKSECEIIDTNIVLPENWKKIYVQRKSGKSAGQYDAYIISSDGKRHRSKNELVAYLENKGILSDFESFKFDFSKKIPNENILPKMNDSINDSNFITNKKRYSDLVISKSEKKIKEKKKQKNLDHVIEKNDTDKQVFTVNKRKDKRYSLPNPIKAKKFCINMNFLSPKSPKKFTNLNMELKDTISNLVSGFNVSEDNNLIITTNHLDNQSNIILDNTNLCNEDTKDILNEISDNEKVIFENDNVNDDDKKTENIYDELSICVSNKENVEEQNIIILEKISPFYLIEEILYTNPWKLIVYTILKKHIKSNLEIIMDDLDIFFSKIPNSSFCNFENLENTFKMMEIKFDSNVVNNLISFSDDFTKGNKPIHELNGINQLSIDAYNIFCLGDWKKVIPEDDALNQYIRWMWDNRIILNLN